MLDKVGEALWFIMFFTPLFTIPMAWIRHKEIPKFYRIGLGFAMAFVISAIIFLISMALFLRNGIGPS
jgi:hypothetical protein